MLPKTLLTFCIVFCANMLYAQGKKTIDKKCTSSMCVNNKGGTMTGNTIIQGNVTNIYNIVGKDTVYMPTRDAQEKIRQAEEIIKREKSIAEREQAVYCLEEALNQPKPPENTELLALDAFKVDIQNTKQCLVALQTLAQNTKLTETAQQEIAGKVAEASQILKGAECFANDYGTKLQTITDSKGNKTFGFSIDVLKNDPNYTYIGEYGKDGIAVVKFSNLYGYINTKGEYIADTKYTEAFPFYGGYGIVKDRNYYYVIDKEGKILEADKGIKQVEIVQMNKNTTATIITTDMGKYIADKTLKPISEAYSSVRKYPKNIYLSITNKMGEYGLVNESNKIIIPFSKEVCDTY